MGEKLSSPFSDLLPLWVISTAAPHRSAPSSRLPPAPIVKRRRRQSPRQWLGSAGDMKRLQGWRPWDERNEKERKRETRGKECALKRRERCFWAGEADAAAGGNASAANALDGRRRAAVSVGANVERSGRTLLHRSQWLRPAAEVVAAAGGGGDATDANDELS